MVSVCVFTTEVKTTVNILTCEFQKLLHESCVLISYETLHTSYIVTHTISVQHVAQPKR